MITFYRCLLYLYPSLYRQEFAEEMVSVFRDAQADVSATSFRERTGFRFARLADCWAALCRNISVP